MAHDANIGKLAANIRHLELEFGRLERISNNTFNAIDRDAAQFAKNMQTLSSNLRSFIKEPLLAFRDSFGSGGILKSVEDAAKKVSGIVHTISNEAKKELFNKNSMLYWLTALGKVKQNYTDLNLLSQKLASTKLATATQGTSNKQLTSSPQAGTQQQATAAKEGEEPKNAVTSMLDALRDFYKDLMHEEDGGKVVKTALSSLADRLLNGVFAFANDTISKDKEGFSFLSMIGKFLGFDKKESDKKAKTAQKEDTAKQSDNTNQVSAISSDTKEESKPGALQADKKEDEKPKNAVTSMLDALRDFTKEFMHAEDGDEIVKNALSSLADRLLNGVFAFANDTISKDKEGFSFLSMIGKFLGFDKKESDKKAETAQKDDTAKQSDNTNQVSAISPDTGVESKPGALQEEQQQEDEKPKNAVTSMLDAFRDFTKEFMNAEDGGEVVKNALSSLGDRLLDGIFSFVKKSVSNDKESFSFLNKIGEFLGFGKKDSNKDEAAKQDDKDQSSAAVTDKFGKDDEKTKTEGAGGLKEAADAKKSLLGGNNLDEIFKNLGGNFLGGLMKNGFSFLTDKLFKGGSSSSPLGGLSSLLGGIGKIFGFADGGYTGDGSKYQVKGLVHAGEYVFPQSAVKAIGVANLHNLAKNGLPSIPSLSSPANQVSSNNVFNFNVQVENNDLALTDQIKEVMIDSVGDLLQSRPFQEGLIGFNQATQNKFFTV